MSIRFALAALTWAIFVTGLRGFLGSYAAQPWFDSITSIKIDYALTVFLLVLAISIHSSRWTRRLRILLTSLTVGIALSLVTHNLLSNAGGCPIAANCAVLADLSAGPVQFGGMSLTGAITLILMSFACFLSLWRNLARFAQIIALIANACCLFSLIAHLYGVNDLFSVANHVSMSMAVAVAGFLLSFSILILRRRIGLVSLFTSATPGAKFVGRIIPAVILIPTALGGFRLAGELLGLYDSRFGLALYAVLNIATLSCLCLYSARWIDRLDRRRAGSDNRWIQSEHQHQAVVDALPQMVWTCLPSGHCDFLNHRWLDYTGAPAAGQLGFGWLHFVYPDDLASIQAAWNQSVQTGLPLDAEYRIRSSKGIYRWFAARAVPLRNADGSISKWFGSSTDIDDRKRTEIEVIKLNVDLEHRVANRTSELQEAIKSLQSVLDASSQVSIIATDPDGLIKIFNTGAEAMLGYRAEEVIGKKTPEILHDPAETESRSAALSEMLGRQVVGFEVYVLYARMGNPESRQWTYVRKDGTQLTVQLSVSPLRSASGELKGFLGIAIDITNRIMLEERLMRKHESLEIAHRDAESANRAKSEFLASMSHEIRTPMNGIIGMTGLLLDTPLTHEQSEFTETIRSSSEALLSLINDILDFSKIEAGKLELENIDFHLRSMLDSTVQLLAPRAEEKGLELTCHLDPNLPEVAFSDPGRLRQILLNLAGNAIKFTSIGDVTIQVGPDPHQPSTLRFSVTDTGIGIPVDRQQKLFQPFSQVDSSTSRKYGGTGLGLAICKDLVTLMGGEIGLTSQPGFGSTFWFTTPLAPARSCAPTLVLLPVVSIKGKRILIVDDSEVSRNLISSLLTLWGCVYEQTESPNQALDMLRASALTDSPFEAALIDYRMPEMSGDELARLIKGDSRIDGVKLILLTSVTQRGHAKSSEAAGFSAYLPKPIRQQDLCDAMEMVLAQGSPKHQLPILTTHSLSESRQRRGRLLVADDNRTN